MSLRLALSRRELQRLGLELRLTRATGRDDCATVAQQAKRQAVTIYGEKKDQSTAAQLARAAAWQRIHAAKVETVAACAKAGAKVVELVPKSDRPRARRQVAARCDAYGSNAAQKARATYKDCRAVSEQAKGERSAAWTKARGARRETFESCMEPVRETTAAERRRLEVQEAQRRDEAKRARAGRRQPVSPAERTQEEIGRARSDLEAYPEGAALLFNQRPQWFVAQWTAARKRGRKISLAEFVALHAEESPEEVQQAQRADSDAWLEKEFSKWKRAA